MRTLSEIVEALKQAGGFGDDIETGESHPIDDLSGAQLNDEERLSASLSLLCRLAQAIDSTRWQDATRSAIARRTREFLEQGGTIDPECSAAVGQFFRNEEAFWSSAQEVYKNIVSKRFDS